MGVPSSTSAGISNPVSSCYPSQQIIRGLLFELGMDSQRLSIDRQVRDISPSWTDGRHLGALVKKAMSAQAKIPQRRRSFPWTLNGRGAGFNSSWPSRQSGH